MTDVLFDSDYAIGFLRKQSFSISAFNKIKDNSINAFMSAITLYELYKGAFLSFQSGPNLEEINKLLTNFSVVNIDSNIVYIASKYFADFKKSGKMIDLADLLIASCAISRNIPILTNNEKHFEKIGELRFFHL